MSSHIPSLSSFLRLTALVLLAAPALPQVVRQGSPSPNGQGTNQLVPAPPSTVLFLGPPQCPAPSAAGCVGGTLQPQVAYEAAFPSSLEEYVGRPEVSPLVAGITVGILGVIGLLAGWFPARSAARLDPVVAMKM